MKKKSILIKILVLALTTGAFSQYSIVFKNGTPTYIFTSNDIFNGPYKDLNTLLSTLPGINGLGDYADRPQIRGADFREMQVIMDGMILTDQITNAPFLNVPLGMIDTLEVIPGGFGAEYGNARSGIVKIKTKQGGDKLHVQANMRYSPPGLKHFGPMAYGKDSPIVIPFVEESAGAFTGNEYFEGWNSYAFNTLSPGEPHYGKPHENYALYLWRHRSQDNLDKLREIVNQGLVNVDLSKVTDDDAIFDYGTTPDWNGELVLHGRLPFSKNARFFLSASKRKTNYGSLIPEESFKNDYYFLKLQNRLLTDLNVELTFSANYSKGASNGNWPEVMNIISRNPFSPTLLSNNIWMPHSITPSKAIHYQSGLKLSYKISDNTHFHCYLNHSLVEFNTILDYRNTFQVPNSKEFPGMTQLVDGLIGTENRADSLASLYNNWINWHQYAKIKIGDIWYDEAPDGYEPTIWREGTGLNTIQYLTRRKNNSTSRTLYIRTNFTNHIKKTHCLKTGFEIFNDRIFESYLSKNGSQGYINQLNAKPWRGNFYLSDAFTFKDYRAYIGFHIDWMHQDKMTSLNNNLSDKMNGPFSQHLLNYVSDYYSFKTDVLEQLNWESKNIFTFNPQISISRDFFHNTSFYFNWGIFNQWPPAHYIYQYRNNIGYANRLDELGNSKLNPISTIKYNAGARYFYHNSNNIGLVLYSKNTTGNIGKTRYYFENAKYDWYYIMPMNSIDTKINGLEFRITHSLNHYVMIKTNFSLFQKKQTGKGYSTIKENGPTIENTFSSDLRPRALIKLNLTIELPKDFGPSLLGKKLLENTNFQLIGFWLQGESFKWKNENIRWKPYKRFDISFNKKLFNIKDNHAIFYIEIFNALDMKNMQTPTEYYYDENNNLTGTSSKLTWEDHNLWQDEFITYMNSLKIKEGDRPGDYPHDGEKEYIQMPGFTPWTFLEKRQVFIGICFKF